MRKRGKAMAIHNSFSLTACSLILSPLLRARLALQQEYAF